jgi:hypothetical protein
MTPMRRRAIFEEAPMTLLDIRRDNDRSGRRLVLRLFVQRRKAFLHRSVRDLRESLHDAGGCQNPGKSPKTIQGFGLSNRQGQRPSFLSWEAICVEAVSSTVPAAL